MCSRPDQVNIPLTDEQLAARRQSIANHNAKWAKWLEEVERQIKNDTSTLTGLRTTHESIIQETSLDATSEAEHSRRVQENEQQQRLVVQALGCKGDEMEKKLESFVMPWLAKESLWTSRAPREQKAMQYFRPIRMISLRMQEWNVVMKKESYMWPLTRSRFSPQRRILLSSTLADYCLTGSS